MIGKFSLKSTVIAAGMAAMVSAPAMAADLFVLSASGASYAEGDVIDSAANISLPSGASLTIMDENGVETTLTGPFDGAPAPSAAGGGGSNTMQLLKALVAKNKESDASLGAVRSGGEELPPLPNAEVLSIHHAGHQCVKKGKIQFWRADASSAIKGKLKIGSKKAKLPFKAGKHIVKVPSKAIKDGKTISIQTGAEPIDITVHYQPKDVAGKARTAAWMVEQGCETQALALLGLNKK